MVGRCGCRVWTGRAGGRHRRARHAQTRAHAWDHGGGSLTDGHAADVAARQRRGRVEAVDRADLRMMVVVAGRLDYAAQWVHPAEGLAVEGRGYFGGPVVVGTVVEESFGVAERLADEAVEARAEARFEVLSGGRRGVQGVALALSPLRPAILEPDLRTERNVSLVVFNFMLCIDFIIYEYSGRNVVSVLWF